MPIYTPEEAANISVAENLEQAFVKGTVNTICRGAPYLAGFGLATGNLPAIAFGISGSIVCGLPLLPFPPPPPPIFEPVVGGQCPVNYRVVVQAQWSRSDGLVRQETSREFLLPGPIGGLFIREIPSLPGQFENQLVSTYGSRGALQVWFSIGSAPPDSATQWDWYNYIFLQREDGLPDDCGSAPPQNLLLPEGTSLPPGWPDAPTIPGGREVVPYLPPNYNDGRAPWQLPIIFPPILLPVFLSPTANIRIPIDAPISLKGELDLFPGANISGEFTLQLDREGNIRTKPDLLPEEGKEEVVCPAPPATTQFTIPYVACSDSSPEFRTGVISAIADSVPIGLSDRLLASADLAGIGCRSLYPPQAAPVMLFSGSVGGVIGRLIISDELDPLISSIRIKIFPQRELDFRETKLFEGTGQRLFGIAAWCLSGSTGGSAPIELWDMISELRLSRSPKPRRLKLLFKPGLRWEVWDTGERIWS